MNRIGWFLLLLTIILSLLSIFILFETSTYTSEYNFGDKYRLVKNQAIWVGLGIIAAIVISRIPHKKLYTLALPMLFGTVVLLVAVFIPGIGLNLKGAHRWINLRIFNFQPSELLKISLSLYLAAWLSHPEKQRLLAFLTLFGACVALVIIQPDMGTALIIAATSLTVYFLSGARISEMAFIFLILIVASFVLVLIAPYRLARFTNFKDFDSKDISSTQYHVKQILISLGSSGFFGVGVGRSIQKYAYLPEATTDSVFAVYAEETGFLGSILLLILFLIQIFLGFSIALRIKDRFGKLLASGIMTYLAIQIIVNVASQAVLIPLTGVPLPFISYGGSAMLINFVAIGILLSIAREIKT